jgi:hypothetical protein
VSELQELLDEWLVSVWMNRPHDGLRDPEHPGRAFTPNQKYAALIEAAGYVPVALGPDDYIQLLPASWRAVNAYGSKLSQRSYDSGELNPLRLQPSGVGEKKHLWEVRHDPYDVSRVHVGGPDGWITVFWKHLDRARSRSASSPGTTPAAAWAAMPPRSRSPTPWRRCCAAPTPARKTRRSRR